MLVSAKTGEGLEGILEKIYEEIIKKTKKFNGKKTIILNLRQASELEEAEFNITQAIDERSEEIIGEHLKTSQQKPRENYRRHRCRRGARKYFF